MSTEAQIAIILVVGLIAVIADALWQHTHPDPPSASQTGAPADPSPWVDPYDNGPQTGQ